MSVSICQRHARTQSNSPLSVDDDFVDVLDAGKRGEWELVPSGSTRLG